MADRMRVTSFMEVQNNQRSSALQGNAGLSANCGPRQRQPEAGIFVPRTLATRDGPSKRKTVKVGSYLREGSPHGPESHMFRQRAFTLAWKAGIDMRQASIAYGSNVDIKHSGKGMRQFLPGSVTVAQEILVISGLFAE